MGRRPPLAGEHLLNRLPRYAKLARDLSLGDAFTDELLHEAATLGAKPSRRDRVFDCLCSDLLDAAEDLCMARFASGLMHGGQFDTMRLSCQP